MSINKQNFLEKIQEYLNLVDKTYKNKQHNKITFSKGYYWSEVKEMQKLEKQFLKFVDENEKYLLKLLETKNRGLVAHLLGWSKNYSKTPKILVSLFTDKNISVVNAAGRALFPMVASNKMSLPITETIKLLKRRSFFAKNKALGLIAFCDDKSFKEFKKFVPVSYIKILTVSKEPIVQGMAKRVLDRYTT